ncbi:transglutaminaseTgpA domain-containing protein [Microbacterium deminutum]|uniref:transglutaminaseTgpA domain-containing protein n=1 Tax=Microbacterium deminutum TaxID=344164 RepID=UPI0031D126B8
MPRIVPRVVAGSLYSAFVVVLAAVAAWPVYQYWSLVVLVAVSAALATAIAVVARRRRWPGWLTAGVVAAAFLVAGVPLAVPSRVGAPADILRGVGELTTGVLLAWKDLVTVDLPVGSYRNLLVPALVVFLAGTCAMLLLSWRRDAFAYAAAPVGIAMVSFGLFFGRTTVSDDWTVGPITLYAPVETALGLATLLTSLLWLAWRTHEERFRALQRAAAFSGVRVSRRPSTADRRRTALGAGMIAVALVVVVALVPAVARGAQRDVLRAAVGPEVDLAAAVSPLAEYRALFADARADDVLFTVASQGVLPERVRLATLDSYDGETYRSGGSDSQEAGRFVRVPSELDAGPGAPVEAQVTIEGLNGIWMPTAGRLSSVDFIGARASSLADRFFYSAAASAGVETAGSGLERGDSYILHGVEPARVDLSAIDAPGEVSKGVAAPESLRTWVKKHVTGSGGGALAGLVSLLRERGYLSHGLPSAGKPALWTQSLPGYRFQPSASGHSLARIDALFTRLLERETDPRAAASGNYVAAVGDDEQFAVAVAMIARELGFPARVVVGARLTASDPDLPTCRNGACRAQDLAVWTEVESSEGEWIPVDVTPQYAQSPSLEVTRQRDPENVTEVRPDSVQAVVPPQPVQDDSGADTPPDQPAGVDLAWLWPVLRTAAIVLLIAVLALGPFLVVIGAKAVRRRARRRKGDPVVRIAGGWEEYVDAAVDAGRDAPRASTRPELADDLATPSAAELAVVADQAVFSGASLANEDAVAFWRIVDDERRRFARDRGLWRRLAATVSLRSFIRHVAPDPGARKRFAERGKRRATEPVRLTP